MDYNDLREEIAKAMAERDKWVWDRLDDEPKPWDDYNEGKNWWRDKAKVALTVIQPLTKITYNDSKAAQDAIMTLLETGKIYVDKDGYLSLIKGDTEVIMDTVFPKEEKVTIAPCPFCKHQHKGEPYTTVASVNAYVKAVKCFHCCAFGPTGNNVKEAIDKWNRSVREV